jgi:hypothetical protein
MDPPNQLDARSLAIVMAAVEDRIRQLLPIPPAAPRRRGRPSRAHAAAARAAAVDLGEDEYEGAAADVAKHTLFETMDTDTVRITPLHSLCIAYLMLPNGNAPISCICSGSRMTRPSFGS